jgi:hypothetical protein
MQQPTTNFQEILFTLIEKGNCSIMDFPYLSGFRTRISEIKEQLNLHKSYVTKINKFGNHYSYAVHTLDAIDKQKAIQLYDSTFVKK